MSSERDDGVCGQSAKEAFNAFRDSVLNQQLVLRNFDGATNVRAVWSGNQFEIGATRWHTFGVLQVHSVKKKGEEIKLECDRRVMVWDDANRLEPDNVVDSVEISIDLQAGDAAQILPQLRDAIFYSSTSEALAAGPKPLQRFVPGHLDETQKNPATVGMPPCDCGQKGPCASRTKVPRSADPEYSEQGRKRMINGSVTIAFIVDESGRTQDVWITRPLGYGMDEEAAKTVFGYLFEPATCHGSPVSVPTTSEINFQIF